MRRFARCVVLVALVAGAAMVVPACGADHSTTLGDMEDCYNDLDDDGDGAIDCADAECHGHAFCISFHEYACDNGVDDDGDDAVDCEDPDCQQTQACDPSREWSCHDGVDNDLDGLLDCLDDDCIEACTERCDDGVDNDGDELADCDDPDCFDAQGCHGGGEICRNGVDDDGDGFTDCDDPDCTDLAACHQVEICNNEGVDDDGDGDADCADSDCVDNPYCQEQCNDAIDNDGNGLVDCDDSVCDGLPGCIENTSCEPSQLLSCGDSIERTTAGRLNNFDAYSCLMGTFDGGELYFLVQAVPGQHVSVTMNDYSTNQDLQLVMFSTGQQIGGCDISDLCHDPIVISTVNQEVSLDVNAISNLWVIIDSVTPGGGFFDLSVVCTAEHELDCTNNQDEDGDGATDCLDSDCINQAACLYWWVDNQIPCSGDTDCAPSNDHFCFGLPNNPTAPGFCSRTCTSPGTYGGLCDTHNTTYPGYCLAEGGSGGNCVLPCGSDFPAHTCPTPGWHCINPVTGSDTNVVVGVCVPPPTP